MSEYSHLNPDVFPKNYTLLKDTDFFPLTYRILFIKSGSSDYIY